MFLRDLDVHATDDSQVDRFPERFFQIFDISCCCVVDMFLSRLHRKLETGQIAKIIVRLTGEITEPSPERIQDYINVVGFNWPFNFETFELNNASLKKRQIFDATTSALLWFADLRDWERTPIEAAIKSCLDADLSFHGISTNSWLSPSGKYRARIYFEYEMGRVDLYAVLFKNRSSKEIARKYLGKGVPSMGCLHYFLNCGKWASETKFTVTGTDFRQQKWKADFSDLQFDE